MNNTPNQPQAPALTAGQSKSDIRCCVTNAELDSADFGRELGFVFLSPEEARHFTATGPHNADISLTDAQQASLGLDRRYDNYITIRRA
jgi:hypothetical protein